MNRDEYIEHLRERLTIAEAIIEKATNQPSVGWQFLENGEWHHGSMLNNHRRNTEEAGYPVRDVYAGPVLNTVEVAQPLVIDWGADAENWGSALNDAGWAFTKACPENSALLFNNTKAPLREAIKVYLAAVAAKHQS